MSDGLTPEQVVEKIKIALARDGAHTWEDVVAALRAGHCQMFWNEHGAWIVEVLQSPRKRFLNVWVVAGELPGVMSLQPQVMEYAREQGCSQVIASARFGWKHVAKAFGWKPHAMVITHNVE